MSKKIFNIASYLRSKTYFIDEIDSFLSQKISKSSTQGLVKNDGTIDTSTYLTSHQSLTNYIQKVTPYGDEIVTVGVDDDGEGIGYANSKLIYNTADAEVYYNKSGLADEDSGNELATMNDIPSLSNYVQKSSTTGLLKNNGEVMTGGTGSTNYAIGNHTHSAYVNPTIADDLTTNDSTQVLSAKQGKVLNDKIGNILQVLNGTGS